MAVSLNEVGVQIARIEGFITTASANNYIATRGTVNNANRLNNIPAGAYRCNGNCSWSASGGAKAVTWPS